jgi:hypothetical protein
MVAATALPPTPVPSGYLATLPPGVVLPTFAPLPAGQPVASSPLPTLAPRTSPSPARVGVRIVSNGLAAGDGELSGAIFEPSQPAPRPVEGVQVFVGSVLDPTRKAELVGASDGTFRLGGIALGDYYVRVDKEGYAADTAPTLMRLYPGYTAGHTLFLIVPLP